MEDRGPVHIAIPVRNLARDRGGDRVVVQVRTPRESKYRELSARGVMFEKIPQKLYWGYGTELRDPDGYLVSVWDEHSMREKGGA